MTTLNFNLSENGEKAIELLEQSGYDAYFVGGCVRDALMGMSANDVDITTSATPEQMLTVFCGFKVILTGLKHGTVTVMIGEEPIEITTFRLDGEYVDHRRPENVSFSANLSDDLSRRDFTVNAMAYNKRRGLIDLYGGESDIKNKVIRAVGNPQKRFEEDALRILRAVRFASQKCFSIAPETAIAAQKSVGLLRYVSAERIFAELKKLIMGDGAESVMLAYPELICAAVPALKATVGFDQKNPHHIYDVYEHTVRAVGACKKDVPLRLAALLHDVGKPSTFTERDGVGHFYGHTGASLELAKQTLCDLKCDNATAGEVLTLIKYHDPLIEPNERAVKRMLGKLGEPLLLKLLDLKSADNLAQAPSCRVRLELYEQIRQIIAQIKQKNECFSIKELAVNGDDLIAWGIPQGREIGKALSFLLESVIDGGVENEKQALKAVLKSRYSDLM